MNAIQSNNDLLSTISIAAQYPTIKRVGVFGSYARGDNTQTSDLDILYDYDMEAETSTDELLDFVDRIDTPLKQYTNTPKIDYVWYEGILKSSNTRFKQAVLNDVIWLYQRQL